MFHGPAEEVRQGLHTQINLSGAAKRGAQETGGKTPPGAYRGISCKAMCSGAQQGPCCVIPANQEREGHGGRCHQLHSEQSAQLRASRERRQQPKAHGSWVPSGAGFGHKSQDPVKSLEGQRGRRKRGIIPPPLCCVGPQLSAGCRHWGSGTVAWQGLWPRFKQRCTSSPAHPPHPPREKQRELRTGTRGKRGWPSCQHSQWLCPSPTVPQDFAGDPHPSQLCRTRQRCTDPSLLQHRNQGLTQVHVLLKMIYKALIL